jgi:hypothetical protein
MPPNPKMPAIRAIIKNVTTQLNMIRTSRFSCCFEQRQRAHQHEINPAQSRKFLPFPGEESAKNPEFTGTKARGGIAPIRGRIKLSNQLQKAYMPSIPL